MKNQQVSIKEPSGAIRKNPAQPRFTEQQIMEANLDNQDTLPDLAETKKHFVPISIEYWSPEKDGEEKFVYVYGVGYQDIPDMETGEVRSLECVMFLEKVDDNLVRLINASKVLVGSISDAIKRGEIIPKSTLTPVAVKFLGKKKNRSNARLSNRWQITPLMNKVEQ